MGFLKQVYSILVADAEDAVARVHGAVALIIMKNVRVCASKIHHADFIEVGVHLIIIEYITITCNKKETLIF